MPHLNTLRDRYEPSRAKKKWFLRTRSEPRLVAGTEFPGLFGTDRYARDIGFTAVGCTLETYGIAIISGLTGGSFLPNAALVLADLSGALLKHYGLAHAAYIENRIRVEDSAEQVEHLRLLVPGWHKAVRLAGWLMIGIVYGFKVSTLLSLAGPTTAIGDLAGALIAFSFTAIIHLKYSGYAVIETLARIAIRTERNAMLKLPVEQRSEHPCYIKVSREHHFISPVPIIAVSIEKHELQQLREEADGYACVLRTWGLLVDTQVEGLQAAQITSEQKHIVGREAVRAQLEILNSEPGGPAEPLRLGATLPPNAPKPGDSAVYPVAAKAAVFVITTLLLFGCVKPQKTGKIAEVMVDAVVDKIEGDKLPAELVDAITFPPDEVTNVVTKPRIFLAGQPSAPVCEANVAAWDPVRRFYGVTPSLVGQMTARRSALQAIALDRSVLDATGAATETQLEQFLSGSNSPPAVILARGVGTNLRLGHRDIPVVENAAAIRAFIGRAAAEKGERVVVFYAPHFLTAKNTFPASQLGATNSPEKPEKIIPPEVTEELPAAILGGPQISVTINSGGQSKAAFQTFQNDALQVGPPIRFAYNSAKLDKSAMQALNKIVSELKRRRSLAVLRIFTRSSADPGRSPEYDQKLSEKRNDVVESILLREGIKVERGYASGANTVPDDLPKNQRGDFREVRIYVIAQPLGDSVSQLQFTQP